MDRVPMFFPLLKTVTYHNTKISFNLWEKKMIFHMDYSTKVIKSYQLPWGVKISVGSSK
jgi:hypothetical protein